MPILNYTTTITAEKTVGEIQAMLCKAKALAIMNEYADGFLARLNFRIATPYGIMTYQLPANINKIHALIQRDSRVPQRLKTREQAARVGWRILKDWLEAQLALIEAGMVELPQVFLPYAQDETGATLYEVLKERKFAGLALPEHAHSD